MNEISLDEIRKRDATAAATWFKQPSLGACGRAFIDRRWLLGEIDRLSGLLAERRARRAPRKG